MGLDHLCDVSWSNLWLNDVIAVGEGSIDVEHGRLDLRYYEYTVELPLPDLAEPLERLSTR